MGNEEESKQFPISNAQLAIFFNTVLEIPKEILLSLATGPVLLGMLGVKSGLDWLQSLGEASEEVFRGDRLPVLHFPDTTANDE